MVVLREAAQRLTAVAGDGVRVAVRAGVSRAGGRRRDRNGPQTGRLRASGVRHHRRVRAEFGPAALSGRRPDACTQVTWWCWTLAGSWTDTAPTSLEPCLSASRHLRPPDSMRRFEKRKRRPSRPSDLGVRRPTWMPPPARCSSRMDWERRSGTARVTAWGSTSTRNLASRSRGQMSRRCGSSRGWSSPSSLARICLGLAASGLRTMSW